ncbi:MAG: methyltransferase domain-containing protein [archaeon]
MLTIGSTKRVDSKSSQHKPQDSFGEDIKITYLDLDKDADIIFDLNELPYPFKDDQFDGVLASHVLEHLHPQKFIEIMKEIHRISKPDSKILIYVPHFSDCISKWHLTHYKLFGIKTLGVICDNEDTGHEKYLRGYFNMEEKKDILYEEI